MALPQLTDEQRKAAVEAGEFIEWAQVHDHRYGTLASEVERNLATGQSLILRSTFRARSPSRSAFPTPFSSLSSPRRSRSCATVFSVAAPRSSLPYCTVTKGTDSCVCCEARHR